MTFLSNFYFGRDSKLVSTWLSLDCASPSLLQTPDTSWPEQSNPGSGDGVVWKDTVPLVQDTRLLLVALFCYFILRGGGRLRSSLCILLCIPAAVYIPVYGWAQHTKIRTICLYVALVSVGEAGPFFITLLTIFTFDKRYKQYGMSQSTQLGLYTFLFTHNFSCFSLLVKISFNVMQWSILYLSKYNYLIKRSRL